MFVHLLEDAFGLMTMGHDNFGSQNLTAVKARMITNFTNLLSRQCTLFLLATK